MSHPSRRALLAGAMVVGAASAAAAQDSNRSLAPIVGNKGGTILGPRNDGIAGQNKDFLHPPTTDHGAIPNLHYAFADTHVKMSEGGWSREVTIRELPAAVDIAGVNMRLNSGGVRELHWHKAAEWSFMLAGKARITAVDNNGHNFTDDVEPGDLWYFPSGIPHSIQGLPPDGAEFVLAFPDGGFSEDNTFSITDMFAHMPKEVLAKNFAVKTTAFDRIPDKERFIFPVPVPPPLADDTINDPSGKVALNMKFPLMKQPATASNGGSVRIADMRNFTISSDIAAALVEVPPGHMREIHWHPISDEWQYYIVGEARMTVFGAQSNARTFDYRAGHVGYVPKGMPHYVENTGSETLRFLELFKSGRYMDVSLKQWMANTPHELVEAHLNIDRGMLDKLSKDKQPIA
jgi:oxalate decarboxylase